MRELSYAGFSVFHDEALMPAFTSGYSCQCVRIQITHAAPGTKIVSERNNTNGPVVGIASDEGFCSIYVEQVLNESRNWFWQKTVCKF